VTEGIWEGKPAKSCPGAYKEIDGILVEQEEFRRDLIPFDALVENVSSHWFHARSLEIKYTRASVSAH
jgi:hypothetical protein